MSPALNHAAARKSGLALCFVHRETISSKHHDAPLRVTFSAGMQHYPYNLTVVIG